MPPEWTPACMCDVFRFVTRRSARIYTCVTTAELRLGALLRVTRARRRRGVPLHAAGGVVAMATHGALVAFLPWNPLLKTPIEDLIKLLQVFIFAGAR
eukprot:6213940-Pleurochrysis_carterae.AAC.2